MGPLSVLSVNWLLGRCCCMSMRSAQQWQFCAPSRWQLQDGRHQSAFLITQASPIKWNSTCTFRGLMKNFVNENTNRFGGENFYDNGYQKWHLFVYFTPQEWYLISQLYAGHSRKTIWHSEHWCYVLGLQLSGAFGYWPLKKKQCELVVTSCFPVVVTSLIKE